MDKTLKETVHFFKTMMLHRSTAPLSNFKLKRVSEVYHVLYNNSAGKNTMYKCQCTYELTWKVRAILYYVHMNTYNIINWNCLRVLVRFHTREKFRATLYIKVSDSVYPVTYAKTICTKTPGHKIYQCVSVRSTQHHTILHHPTILHME